MRAGLPEDFDAEQPLNLEGRNDKFASEFAQKVAAIREHILGDLPQLRQCSIFIHNHEHC